MYQKYSSLISSKKGASLIVLVEAVVAIYVVVALAIETGNLGYYILFLFLAGDIIRRIINLFKKSKNKANAKRSKRSKNSA